MASRDDVVAGVLHAIAVEQSACQALQPAQISDRLRRLPESELAHRVRTKLSDENAFVFAQKAPVDIVADDIAVEIQVKYLLVASGTTPYSQVLADWNWMNTPSAQTRARYFVCFYPRANSKALPDGRPSASSGTPTSDGSFRLQQCLSSLNGNWQSFEHMLRPYVEKANIPLVGGGARLRQLYRFKEQSDISARAVVRGSGSGNPVRFDILGRPHVDPVWAALYQAVSAADAATLRHGGYPDLR